MPCASHPSRATSRAHGLGELAPYIAFGVSPRGPISMLHAARALAVLRGRNYVLPSDVHELAPDAMRHRIVLSYRALAEGVSSEAIIAPVLDKRPDAAGRARERGRVSEVALALVPPDARHDRARAPYPRPRCALSI